MDSKETNLTVAGTDSPASGIGQPTPVPFISSKSLIPTTATQVKLGSGRTSPGANVPKILSRNCNGTVVLTSSPNNEAELQLYRVMQRASLLAYYDTLLEMGGDDVQQLCDAGEEEFLEIMALVGMASKPLHVRRLQKALQEWVTSPALFQTPLNSDLPVNSTCPTQASNSRPSNALPPVTTAVSILNFPTPSSSHVNLKATSPSVDSMDANQAVSEITGQKDVLIRPVSSPSPHSVGSQELSPLSHQSPVLVESQILRLAEFAETLVKTLPQFEPKPHNTKKKICRNLDNVMKMTPDDPRRMDEIRKYSAIYGRFDCKRNPQKPLTLHEVSVNEAAAQICRFAPALLTRRDDLFSLARQVVRDSGYHFTKAHSGSTDENPSSKRARIDGGLSTGTESVEIDKLKRQDRLEQIADELRILGDKTEELVQAAQKVRQKNDVASVQSLQQEMESVQSKQTQLLVEQSELLKQPLPSRFYRRNGSRISSSHLESDKNDTDDTDSQFSFSNASSSPPQVGDPVGQEVGDLKDSLLRDGENCGTNGNASPSVKSPCKFGKQVGPK